jgi:hypothetical protein
VKAVIHVVDSPVSPLKRVVLMLFFTVLISGFQHVLNSKGQCTFMDPDIHTVDVIDDLFVRLTVGLNRWFISNPDIAAAFQAVSSLWIDFSVTLLICVGSTRRSSARPFIALFLFFFLRFFAQLIAVIPCAPGWLWPEGKLFGFNIPTVFVDYTPANDMFFSGHSGTAIVIGLEMFELDYHRFAWFQLTAVFPFMAVWVVSLRAHRGIDVFAAVLAAIVSSSVAKSIADSVDRQLQVNRRIRHNNNPQRGVSTPSAASSSATPFPKIAAVKSRKKTS